MNQKYHYLFLIIFVYIPLSTYSSYFAMEQHNPLHPGTDTINPLFLQNPKEPLRPNIPINRSPQKRPTDIKTTVMIALPRPFLITSKENTCSPAYEIHPKAVLFSHKLYTLSLHSRPPINLPTSYPFPDLPLHYIAELLNILVNIHEQEHRKASDQEIIQLSRDFTRNFTIIPLTDLLKITAYFDIPIAVKALAKIIPPVDPVPSDISINLLIDIYMAAKQLTAQEQSCTNKSICLLWQLLGSLISPQYISHKKIQPMINCITGRDQPLIRASIKDLLCKKGEICPAMQQKIEKLVLNGYMQKNPLLYTHPLYTIQETMDIWAIAFHPSVSTLASTSWDHSVNLHNNATRSPICSLQGHSHPVKTIAFTPDGQILASGSNDATIILWDTDTKTIINTLLGHTGFITSITFSPDGKTLFSASNDHTIRIWETETGNLIHTIEAHSNIIVSIAYNPHNNTLVSTSFDGTIKLWNTHTYTCLSTIDEHIHFPTNISFNTDGTLLSVAALDQTIRLYETKTNTCIQTIVCQSPCYCTSFHPNGQLLAIGLDDGSLTILDINNHENIQIMRNNTDLIRSITFSPDGCLMAVASKDCTITLYGCPSLREAFAIPIQNT